jgi:hypothetical protein
MTKLMQEIFHHILQLSEEKQNMLAPYLQEHLVEPRHQLWRVAKDFIS